MIVGEAPGVQEDEYGYPFVGKSGTLLKAVLGEIGLDATRDVYYTNVVKCHPESNRNPTVEEIDNCFDWLAAEIGEVRPRKIIAVGKIPHLKLLARNVPHEHVYHPAYILRNRTKRDSWKEQLRRIAFDVTESGHKRLPLMQDGPPDPGLPIAIDVETDDLEEGIGVKPVLFQLSDGIRAVEMHTRPPLDIFTQPPVYFHNAKYDAPLVGVNLRELDQWEDTALMAYLLRRPRVGLKELALSEFGHVMMRISDVLKWPDTMIDKKGKERTRTVAHSFSQALEHWPDRAIAYAKDDAFVTAHLARTLEPELRAIPVLWSYYNSIERPTTPILYEMERRGAMVDKAHLLKVDTLLEQQMQQHADELTGLHGEGYNPRSNRDVAKMLQASGAVLTKRTTTGDWQTSKDILLGLCDAANVDDVVPDSLLGLTVLELLEYKRLQKLRSTYTGPLALRADVNSRIHARFNQMVANTNRLSSSEPNLQNIPIRGLIGKELRKAFIAPPGKVLVKADCSQLQVRIYTHYTQEPILLDAYLHTDHDTSGPGDACSRCDVHQRVADAAGCPRWRAKNGLFARLFGCTDEKFALTCGVELPDVADFLARLSREIPSLAGGWRQHVKTLLESQGYIETYFGFREYFPGFYSPFPNERAEALRQAGCHPIQGTESGYMKKLIMAFDEFAPDYDAELILTVHDEVVYELPPQRAAAFMQRLETTCLDLSRAIFTVPVLLETSVGHNWGETMPLFKFLESTSMPLLT